MSEHTPKAATARRMWTDDDQIYFKSGGPGETLSGISVRNPILVLKWDKASRDALEERIRVAIGIILNTSDSSWTANKKPYERIAEAAVATLTPAKDHGCEVGE